MCGKLQKQRDRHIAAGEDPDDPRLVFADVAESLEEAKVMLEKGMKKFGLDPAKLKAEVMEDGGVEYEIPASALKLHPLQKQTFDFIEATHEIFHGAMETESLWIETEAADDLNWYPPIVAAKLSRQLDNLDELAKIGDEKGAEIDCVYTCYALTESLRILEASLRELAGYASPQKGELSLALAKLLALKKQLTKVRVI